MALTTLTPTGFPRKHTNRQFGAARFAGRLCLVSHAHPQIRKATQHITKEYYNDTIKRIPRPEERKRLAIVAWFAGEGITNCKEFCKEMAQIADAAFSGANGRVTWLALAKSAALFGCSSTHSRAYRYT